MGQPVVPGYQDVTDDKQLARVLKPRPARLLGLHHFAFFRSFLEGLDLRQIAERYLETGADRWAAKSTLQWVLDALVAAAKLERPGMARLLRIPPERLKPPPDIEVAGEPFRTLDEFIADEDPSGFYLESEIITLYEQALAKAQARPPREQRRIDRNAALRERQIKAVRWLEGWIAKTPKASDPIAAWLDPRVADRLEAAGVETVQKLIDLINERGQRWWSKVPKLGPKGAALLVRWVQMNKVEIGSDIEATAIMPYKARLIALRHERAHEFGIVPMEFLAIPDDLSGQFGRNRAFGTALDAKDDLDAINAWLATRRDKPHTLRSYRTNVERFLLWALLERRKALSSLTSEDCASYRDWLAALDPDSGVEWRWSLPREDWIGPRSAGRASPAWRPFAGPLKPVSQNLARTVCLSMFGWLTRQKYLETNPWDGVSERIPARSASPVARSFTPEQWAAIKRHLDGIQKDERGLRLQFALWFAACTGLRLSELAKAKLGDFSQGLPDPELGETWELKVVGKRNKERIVPVPAIVMQYLANYLSSRGIVGCYPRWPQDTLLLATLGAKFQHASKGNQPMSTAAIYGMFTRMFREIADSVRETDFIDAMQFEAASVHWCRHTMARSALDSGADLRDVMAILGHESITTTQLYVTTGRRARQRAVARLVADLQSLPSTPR